MTSIRTDNGVLETERISGEYEPVFCARCGERLGWLNTEFSDSAMVLCDEHMREAVEEEDEET